MKKVKYEVHGLCIVKNEADVIEECITAALRWCDHIYVFDNGSTDGTWDLVQKLSERHPQIVPYKQDESCFMDGLRADIFNAFRSRGSPGDWWCRLDADEFYIDDPRIFLAKIPAKFSSVWTASFSYYFTDKDAQLYRQKKSTPKHQFNSGFATTSIIGVSKDFSCIEIVSSGPAKTVGPSLSLESSLTDPYAVASVRQTRDGFAKFSPDLVGVHWEERVVPACSQDFDWFDRRYVVNEGFMPQIPQPKSKYYEIVKQMLPRSVRKQLKEWLG